jgi:hypothetical protein
VDEVIVLLTAEPSWNTYFHRSPIPIKNCQLLNQIAHQLHGYNSGAYDTWSGMHAQDR